MSLKKHLRNENLRENLTICKISESLTGTPGNHLEQRLTLYMSVKSNMKQIEASGFESLLNEKIFFRLIM